jgi:hypothetical protein
MQTYEIFQYPLESTRNDADLFDEVTCEEGEAQDLCRALKAAHRSDNLWFFYKVKSTEPPVEHRWEQAGQYMQDDTDPDPVDDALFESLRGLLNATLPFQKLEQ